MGCDGGGVAVKCTMLMKGKATHVKVSQEVSSSVDTGPGKGACSLGWGGSGGWGEPMLATAGKQLLAAEK